MELKENELPFNSLAELKIHNDEPLTYAYFNTHMLRLLENIKHTNNNISIQKATPIQWGLVRLASIEDLISEDGDKNAVITNAVLIDTINYLKKQNSNNYIINKTLPLSKNYEWQQGSFVIGIGENIAKKITDKPENVVYANLNFIPLGFEDKCFRMAKTIKDVDSKYFTENLKTCGIINFNKIEMPKEYKDFHVYYHNAGYVICKNERLNDAQKQIKILWTLLVRK